MSGGVTVRLARPITAHGAEVAELTLREPKPSDVAAAGFPMLLIDGGVIPQPEAVNALIVRLGGIPRSSVEQLTMPDWQAVMGAVLRFFGTADPGSSSGPTTLPTSGG